QNRGWGIEIDPDFHKKQKDIWDQVSKRSSLSALSLASSIHRPITKEEKDNENNKKSIPTKSLKATRVPGQWHSVDNKDEAYILPQRFTTIRHHLERTTGPAITKRESESQRGSPKKTATSRHGSPQKGSPQKGSPKKTIKVRSQSVGPGAENESPKRQIRSASTAPPQPKGGKKTPVSTPTSAVAVAVTERKPRP
uniref:Nuclear protein MDM1 n=1 Tax=Megaselia scalaris TaxID=36166 RepID=T1GR30_MEGSC